MFDTHSDKKMHVIEMEPRKRGEEEEEEEEKEDEEEKRGRSRENLGKKGRSKDDVSSTGRRGEEEKPRREDEEEDDEEEEEDNEQVEDNDEIQRFISPKKKAIKFKGGYKNVSDKSLWLRIEFKNKYLQFAEVSLNPVVTFLSLILIVVFVAWSIAYPTGASQEFGSWKAWIGRNFTWLYIGAMDIWAAFIFYILLSKYSGILLGKPGSKPEFNNATWFTMLFSCGVSTGLFFFGVAEPILHYTTKNRHSADPSMTDNKLAQEAITLTLYHWGIHAWVVYCVIGLLLAIISHREGLPLTIKSCFYPLIGDKIFGWPGDLVDVLSVIATIFGVCTSLGLGTIQMISGFNLLNRDIENTTKTQVITIWIITCVATVSVVTGMKKGIRRLSEFCFTCGLVLMLCVLFLDQTVYILNLYIQSMGHYFQWTLQMGTHTDAFESLGPSHGSEDRGRVLPPDVETTDGPSQWMEWWTVFYWGWWIAWCPFVGMFIAKISYGRTVKEFIIGTMAAPVLYVIMWMIIFGGAGIRMEREAAGEGLCCHNVNVSQLVAVANQSGEFSYSPGLCEGECNPCSVDLLTSRDGVSHSHLAEEILQVGEGNWGFSTPNRNLTRLSCRNVETMWFDLMMSYQDLGKFLSGFSLLSLILYFVTSMDSGSLVIDSLASNGCGATPAFQRVCWACLEGLTSTALLVAGGEKALEALQTVSIATGLVYLVLIFAACVALMRALEVAAGDVEPYGPEFAIDLLDPLLSDPLKELFSRAHWERTKFNISLFPKLLCNILIAPYSVAKASAALSKSNSYLGYLMSLSTLLLLVAVFGFFSNAIGGVWALGVISYIAFAFVIATVRKSAREAYGISGDLAEDLILSLVMYPAVALQLIYTVEEKTRETQSGTSINQKWRDGKCNGKMDIKLDTVNKSQEKLK